MEELFTVLGTGAIILIILAILPYIALIGTWINTGRMKNDIEDMREILITQSKLIDIRTQEIQALQRQSGIAEIPPVMRE